MTSTSTSALQPMLGQTVRAIAQLGEDDQPARGDRRLARRQARRADTRAAHRAAYAGLVEYRQQARACVTA